MRDNSKLAQIRALLAKAEASNYAEEAEAFRAKAHELIAKYDVDERLVSAAQGQDRSAVAKLVIVVSVGYRKQQLRLIHRIAKALGVYSISIHSEATLAERARVAREECRYTQPQRDAVELWGTEDTNRLVELLFTSLLVQVTNELERVTIDEVPAWFRSHYRSNGGAVKSWRTDWYGGWATKVGERLAEAHGRAVAEAAEAGNVGAELVLASDFERFEAAAREEHTTIVKRSSRFNAHAHNAGGAAGERADIGLTRVGEQRRALTG